MSIKTKVMKTETQQNNPMICDPVEGVCGMPGLADINPAATGEAGKKAKIVYFTDPICSSCWGIEPQLRKLKLEYGNQIDIEYRMGGLLPDWNYNSGSISKPSDVAHHWDEVSEYYDMPIDGDVWLEDPLSSSFPSSIAFKAAQLQDQGKALLLMRELREMVFLKKKNIAKWEHISAAAQNVGLDVDCLEQDVQQKGKDLFREDLDLAREYMVRGFPSMFFIDADGKRQMVYGTKVYQVYEGALNDVLPTAVRQDYKRDWKSLFAVFSSLTAREYAELAGIDRTVAEQQLEELSQLGLLDRLATKNGSLWSTGSNR